MVGFSTIETGTWPWVIALSFLAFYTFQSIASYRRLSSFRGPHWAAWSQTWLFKQTVSGSLYLTLRDVSVKYGKCVVSLLVLLYLMLLMRDSCGR